MHYHSLPYKQEGTLGRANVRKDFLDYNWGQEKNWPIADGPVFNNNPRNNCGTHFGSSLLLVSKVANF